MRVIAAALLAAFVLFAGPVAPAGAAPDTPLAAPISAPLAAPPASAAAETDGGTGVAGLWRDALVWIQGQQRALTGTLARSVRTLRDERTPAAAWGLIVASFLYGVFHAAGPGHGKAVIAAYLVTHRAEVRRGLALAWASALLQGVVAVALVLGLVHLAGVAARGTRDAVAPLESVSFALVGALGLWLSARAALALLRGRAGHDHAAHAGGAHEGHAACCHAHMPDPARVARLTGWREAVPLVVSVGIRPCSGAVVVLLLAEALDLRPAGIAAAFAMAVGTAATVSLLALATVYLRRFAGLFARADGRAAVLAGRLAALAGGLVILVLGAALFAASLGPRAAPPL